MSSGPSDEVLQAQAGLNRGVKLYNQGVKTFGDYYTNPQQFGNTVTYDSQGNATLSQMQREGKSAQAKSLENYLNMGNAFKQQTQMYRPGTENPYLNQAMQKAAGQVQATYGGMGILGTSAGASAIAQSLSDTSAEYANRQQEMYSKALGQEAGYYGQGMQLTQAYDQYQQGINEAYMQKLLSLMNAQMGVNTQMTNTMVGAQGNLSFAEQLGLGLVSGGAQVGAAAIGKK